MPIESRLRVLLSVLAAALIPALLGGIAVFSGLSNTYTLYRSTGQEIRGVWAARHIHHLVLDLQLMHGLLSTQEVSGHKPYQDLISTLEYDMQVDLDNADWNRWALGLALDVRPLRDGLRELAARRLSGLPASVLTPQYQKLIEQTRELLGAVLDHSELILDPELSTYHLINIAIGQLPALSASVSELHAAGGLLSRAGAASFAQWRLVHDGVIVSQTRLQSIRLSLRSLARAGAPTPASLSSAISTLEQDIAALQKLCPSFPCASASPAPLHTMLAGMQATKDHLNAAFDAATGQIEELLLARRARFLRQMLYTAAIALVATIATFGIALWFSTRLRAAQLALRKISETDPLTGIPNRRRLEPQFKHALATARRSGQGFALGLVDVDFFKRYNDTYGHQEGDAVLKAVAQSLQQVLQRGSDHLFRFGGEEFCFFFPAHSTADLQLVCTLIRQTVEQLGLAHTGNPPSNTVTVSIGIVFLPAVQEETLEQLVAAADRQLYAAKKNGRNRCELGLLEPTLQ